MRGRFEGISDSQWEIISSLMPQPTKRVGRPNPDLRKVLNTILYVEITGCRWCDVPIGEQWAKRSTAHEWLGLLQKCGAWERVKNGIVCMADLAKLIDWSKWAVDDSFSPGKEGGDDVDYGYKGKGVTNHLLVEGKGMPLAATTTPASNSEREQVSRLLQRLRIYHGYGRPKHCPHGIHADKGSRIVRIFLRSKGVRPVIPRRVWNARKHPQGRKPPVSTSRWQVERCFAWMQKKYRRLVARWERREAYWNGFCRYPSS